MTKIVVYLYSLTSNRKPSPPLTPQLTLYRALAPQKTPPQLGGGCVRLSPFFLLLSILLFYLLFTIFIYFIIIIIIIKKKKNTTSIREDKKKGSVQSPLGWVLGVQRGVMILAHTNGTNL